MTEGFGIWLDIEGIRSALPSDRRVGTYSIRQTGTGHILVLVADGVELPVRTYPNGTSPEQIIVDTRNDLRDRIALAEAVEARFRGDY